MTREKCTIALHNSYVQNRLSEHKLSGALIVCSIRLIARMTVLFGVYHDVIALLECIIFLLRTMKQGRIPGHPTYYACFQVPIILKTMHTIK